MKFSLAQQIEEVRGALDMRARVYPRLILQKTISQREADFFNQRMRAVLVTLEALEAVQDQVRPILIAAQGNSAAGLK